MNNLDIPNLHCLDKCEFLCSIAFSFAIKIKQSDTGEMVQLVKYMITLKDMGSDLQFSCEKLPVVAQVCDPSLSQLRWEDPWGSLARYSSRICELQIQYNCVTKKKKKEGGKR